MLQSTQALVETLAQSHDTAGLPQKLFGVAKQMGFDYFAYGIKCPIPIFNPRIELLGNYPDSWQKRYKAEKYAAIDPAVRHCSRTTVPLLWSCETFAEVDFAEEAISHRIGHGVSVCIRDAKGHLGMLTLARDASACSPQEFSQLKSAFTLLGQVAHAVLSEQLTQRVATVPTQELSGRELEVLKWTAEGKTSEEVALIMSITKRTVNFHINNCVAKLDASNKLHATVKAAVLGLLS